MADLRGSSALSGSAMHRDVFADRVVASDFDPGFLALEFEVLRDGPDRGERENPALFSNLGPAVDDDMGLDLRPRVQDDVFTDN